MTEELKTDVLIVGGGSRALILLERLASVVASVPGRALKVTVAEPGILGQGLHQTDQRPYITFNTPSSCPTIFINQRVPNLASSIRGPSFEEWLTTCEDACSVDYQPRAVVGRYLSWSAQHLMQNFPPNLQVEHLRESIVQAAPPVAGRLTFHTDMSTRIRARAAVIAVGHNFAEVRRQRLDAWAGLEGRIVTNPFPTHVRLQALDGRHIVAIRGLGLTALDVLAELTIGRGGRFEPTSSGAPPRYVASGDEPMIYMYSRSSCPVRARPDGLNKGDGVFTPVILTDDRAALLLDRHRPIEFRTAVFPLILAEMAHRLLKGPVRGVPPECLTLIRQWFASGGLRRSNTEICTFFQSPNINKPLFELIRPVLRNGIPGTKDLAIDFLREDIFESRLGILGSSLKYALEVLIEARVFVKALVDFRHDIFSDLHWIFRTFSSLVNRNVIGPQPGKCNELISLLNRGLVEIAPGGSSVMARHGRLILAEADLADGIPVDYLIRADHLNFATSAQAGFIQSLISTGLALPILDAEEELIGLKIDQQMRLLSRDQRHDYPLWGTGPICDGSAYYNNYVPCIQPDAEYPYFEANQIACGILEWLRLQRVESDP